MPAMITEKDKEIFMANEQAQMSAEYNTTQIKNLMKMAQNSTKDLKQQL